MSTIIKKVDTREHGHIVQTDSGSYYYVDSAWAFDRNKYETMVFPCNKNGYVKNADWKRYAYVEYHHTKFEMAKRHEQIINALDNYTEVKA